MMVRGLLRTLSLVLGLTAAGASAAELPAAELPGAELPEAEHRRLVEAIATGYAAPRYAALEAATARLDAAAESFCAAPARPRLVEMRRHHAEAADAWQRIQHVRFGPIEYFSRSARFAFWPDPRNSVGRAVEELLKADPAQLAPDVFGRGNVAGQGFPALERLVFADGAEAQLMAGDDGARRRCAVLRAITRNLAGMAADVHREWVGGDRPFVEVLRHAGASDSPYQRPSEATLDVVKALHLAVELVSDHKLSRPLGASVQAARPRLAEAWRSGRSLDNVRLDLAAGAELYEAGFADTVRRAAGDAALDDLMRRAFAQSRATAAAIGPSLEAAVADARRRPSVERLVKETAALKALVAQRLTAALGIPLGFNALDGD
ncbi:imelysin family protein [Stella sp.]|uniref:imelysin family protein n=1 Tax=Stella sp. TaxID=2912054 RepID=UPI0035B187D0